MLKDGFEGKISHHLNVIGFFCPVPLSETKKALNDLKKGDILEVVADDPETLHDLPMLIQRMPHLLKSTVENAGEIHFIIEVK